MESPPRIRRTRRNRSVNRNTNVRRTLFSNTNSNNTERNNNIVSMTRTPNRDVNAYNNNQLERHRGREKQRSIIEQRQREENEKHARNVEEYLEKKRMEQLSHTPTKSAERKSRKRKRSFKKNTYRVRN